MSDHDFEAGELHVYSINNNTMKHGVKSATVFRADEVDEENRQVRGDIVWTNKERRDAPDDGKRVDEGRISAPFVHTERLEG